jgi:hypothetical protein
MQGRDKENLARKAYFRAKARKAGWVRITSNYAAVKLAKGGFSKKVGWNEGVSYRWISSKFGLKLFP